MKKTTLIFISLLIGFSAVLFSKNIDFKTAEKVALNFIFERLNAFEKPTNYNNLFIIGSKLVDDAYYVFNFEEGWVLVSANDVMVPILGYNYSGSYPEENQQGENFKTWMQHYADQIQFIRKSNFKCQENTDRWNKYLTDNPDDLIKKFDQKEVEPLLTCTWHQIYPYNIMCPEDQSGFGGYVPVGCGATAIAQIMNYWRYPLQGSGSYSYYCYPYGTLTANFGESTYEWDAMQDNIDFDNPWEIAEISYHAAVSVMMQFGPDGSSSSLLKVPDAMSTYFKYDPSIDSSQKTNYSQQAWEDMIIENLDLFRPLYYRAAHPVEGGHLFVCDGYQDPDYFHFNFGWSGNGNGYYTLEDLYGFNQGQWLVKNIFPGDPNYPNIANGIDTLTYLSGSFTDGSGPAEDYPPEMGASWLIDPQSETDSVSTITLTFIQFNTAPSDYLRVYDGETTNNVLLGEYSGDELPANISSSGNKMLVTFSTSGTAKGFKIEYHPSFPDYCQNQQTYIEPTGTISDGSSTFNYCNGTTCIYIIDCPSAIKYNLEFTSFSTGANEDIVRIYNGDENLIDVFSGSELPELMELETNKVFITWSTNEIFTDAGWSFDYTVDFTGIAEKTTGNNLSIVPNPFTGSTILVYELLKPSTVQLIIYNHFGENVKDINMDFQTSGMHQIFINGNELSAGVYFCALKTNEGMITKKIIKL